MGNPQFLSVEDNIVITNFSGSTYVRIKFWQQHEGSRYYRLRCFHRTGDYAPSDFPVTYIYLGSYSTSPAYQYTVSFKIQSASPSFQSLFERYNNLVTLSPSVELQSSASSSFNSYETSNEVQILNIQIKGSFFDPLWSRPTWEDEMYTVSAGVRTLTGSPSKGVRGFSVIRFNIPQATALYNTTITKYNINVSGAFSASYTPQEMAAGGWKFYLRLPSFPKLYGSVNVTFSVVDSRGSETSFSSFVQIVNYQKPYLTVNDTHRQGGTGSTLILNIKGEWNGSPLTDSMLTCDSITAYEQGSSTPLATLTPSLMISNKSFSYAATWDGVTFDSKKSYSISVVISDTVQTVTITFPVTVGIPVMAIRRDRVGVNNPDPQAALDVTGEIFQNGFPTLGYVGLIGDSDSANLNDYTDTGYYVYKAGDSREVSNFPEGNTNTHLLMMVISAKGYNDYKYGVQKVWWPLTGDEYTRTFYANSFSAWKKVTVT